ncbi:ataxin-3 protein, partial [Trifolium medium]|nr:ataxin-3 protein [Trifolium medium]
AIAASLMDSSPVVTNAEASAPQNDDKQKSIQVETIEEASLPSSDERNQVASSFGGDKSRSENQNKENTP